MKRECHCTIICLVIGILGLTLYGGEANADDWPRFQGLYGNCTSRETGLMKEWPADGPEVLWTTKVGAGFGGVVVEKGRVYILDLAKGNGLVRLTGPVNIFGDVQIAPNATLEISDGTTLIKGQCTCNSGTIHLKGGWIIPQGGLIDSDCNIIREPGLYNDVADFNLDGKVDLMDSTSFADTWLSQTSL